MSLDPSTHVIRVHLTVSDLNRSVRFYEERVGFTLLDRDGMVATIGVGKIPLVVLHESASASRPRRSTGLYHFAILVPSRGDLARAFQHLIETRTPMVGYSDHGVSEAIYLADPDMNGIEIYRDRPRAQWPFVNGELQMGSKPLDVQGLIADPGASRTWTGLVEGTYIGHVHLHVAHLDEAERFYRDALGLDLIQRYAGTASFLSAGGYHHHVAVNTWAGEGAPPLPPGAIGLHHYTLGVPTEHALAAVEKSLTASGVRCVRKPDAIEVSDPSGNRIVVAVEPR